MVLFLANRSNIQTKRLHRRIKNKLGGEMSHIRLRRARARDPGPYRVVGEVNPRQYLGDTDYPVTSARIEIGFKLRGGDAYEHYWINWIEPDRKLLVGWHQDDDHESLGPVHLQLNRGPHAIDHKSARFIDAHPLDVVEKRLAEIPAAVEAVEWVGSMPEGLDPPSLR
jgi:hypothetical protein